MNCCCWGGFGCYCWGSLGGCLEAPELPELPLEPPLVLPELPPERAARDAAGGAFAMVSSSSRRSSRTWMNVGRGVVHQR